MLDTMIEYMKLHIISLEQDLEEYNSEDDTGYLQLGAAISTARHFIEVAKEIKNGN